MRRQHFTYLIFSSILFIYSCSKPENELESYLKKVKLPIQEDQIFVLIPANQCGGCFYYNIFGLSDSINKHVTVIKAHPKANISNFKNVFVDKEDILSSLSIHNNQNKIVVSRKGKLSVVSIYDIKKQLDSTYNEFYY